MIAELSKVTYRDLHSANNAYIRAQIKFDEVLKTLAIIRKDMGACENWAHAEGTCHDVNELVELTNRLRYLATKHDDASR